MGLSNESDRSLLVVVIMLQRRKNLFSSMKDQEQGSHTEMTIASISGISSMAQGGAIMAKISIKHLSDELELRTYV